MVRPLTHQQVYDYFINRTARDITHRGELIASMGYNAGTWVQTFLQDFADVSTAVVDTSEATPHSSNPSRVYARGSYDSIRIGKMATKAFVPTGNTEGKNSLYVQGDASVLRMGAGRFTAVGPLNYSTNLETMRLIPGVNVHACEDGVTTTSEGFEQQYGYFACRMKTMPTYRSDTMIAWPAFWTYSNRWNLRDKPTIEDDSAELYISSRDNVLRGDGTHHTAWHYHNPPSSVLAPGYISTDYNMSGQTMSMNPNPTFGADVNFEWGDAYHEFGLLYTPEWKINYMDGIEIQRIPMIDEYHQKMHMLVSHQTSEYLMASSNVRLTKNGVTGWEDNVIVWMDVDWLKSWQNPDWDNLAIGGTADALTMTSGLPMTGAYENGRIFSGTVNAPNGTATPTLNVNGLGPKVIKKYSSFLLPPPWNGGFIAVAPGDLVGRCNFKYVASENAFILLNPGRSLAQPTYYQPPLLTGDPIALPRRDIEGRIAAEWNKVGQLVGDDHPGKAITFDPNVVQPRCLPNLNIQTVETRKAGDLAGQCRASNNPPVAPRATWSGPSQFRVNRANGDLYHATDNPAPGTYEGDVSFWSPGIPSKKGANVRHVIIEVKEDIPFDMSFFGANLNLEYDFDKPSSLTLVGGKISAVADQSSFANNASQTDDTKRPGYDAAGLVGKGCLVSTIAGDVLAATSLVYGVNLVNLFGYFPDGTAGIRVNGFDNKTPIFEYTAPHIIMFYWSPLGVKCKINGTSVEIPEGTIPTTSGWAIAVAQADGPAGTYGAIYSQNEAAATLLAAPSGGSTTFNGKVGRLALSKSSISEVNVDKVIGYYAHQRGMTGLLPSGHPYKNNPPRYYS
ncbi:glycoside hydrolase family 16 protein [Sphingobium phenoxybenzoativorans]|uniref:Glycoside hydrolase family 16 protein n=1 Tax=Sphingobium phenoxybenzoativorans TaxID=1592790 RepID=A0A975K376_9SPHN|nr:glycoside hydrolase family 16 protein [Sphingobium phenoxybenzoativorans]QUT04073.1 glycoside hydrolase family 16 protein [Sphingobium phenoxybenzoativorans]